MNFILEFLIIFIVFVVIIIVVIRSFLSLTTIDGCSMEPTLLPGDRILIFRCLPLTRLCRGQIITVELPQNKHQAKTFDNQSLVKYEYQNTRQPNKQIGNPDDMGSPDSMKMMIEGTWQSALTAQSETVDYSYTPSRVVKRLVGLPGDTIKIHLSELHESIQPFLSSKCDADGNLVWQIPEGHGFIRGDGVISIDSTFWGPVPLKLIKGIMLTKLSR